MGTLSPIYIYFPNILRRLFYPIPFTFSSITIIAVYMAPVFFIGFLNDATPCVFFGKDERKIKAISSVIITTF